MCVSYGISLCLYEIRIYLFGLFTFAKLPDNSNYTIEHRSITLLKYILVLRMLYQYEVNLHYFFFGESAIDNSYTEVCRKLWSSSILTDLWYFPESGWSLKSIFYKKGAKIFVVARNLQKLSHLTPSNRRDNLCKYRATTKILTPFL